MKTSDEKEKEWLSEKQTIHYNTKSAKGLSDTCKYDVEAQPMRKDSSKSVKVNKGQKLRSRGGKMRKNPQTHM